MALPACGYTLTAVGERVICFGGIGKPAVPLARPGTAPSAVRVGSLRPATASGGLRASAAIHAYSLTESRWHVLEAEAGDAPDARSGHTAISLGGASLLVHGGAGARHEKLADVWQLSLTAEEERTSVSLELVLDAWTAERAQREAAAAAAAASAAAADAAAADAAAAANAGKVGKGGGGKGGGGKSEPAAAAAPAAPKAVFSVGRVARSLGGALGGLPSECFMVSVGGEVGAEAEGTGNGDAAADGLRVSVEVRPLKGVGLRLLGVDGDALPDACVRALEAVLASVCPLTPEVAEDGKGAKDAKGKKGGAAEADDVGAGRVAAARAAQQMRVAGFPILSWVARREKRSEVVECTRWVRVPISARPPGEGSAEDDAAEAMPAPRSAHSATKLSDGVYVFGGAGARGLCSDLWVLRTVTDGAAADAADGGAGAGGAAVAFRGRWERPEVAGTPPCARAHHTACGRLDVTGEAVDAGGARCEQLVVFGGSGGSRGQLDDLHVLSVPGYFWSSPRVSGVPPSARCWHTAGALCPAGPASPLAFGMLVFGGVSAQGAPLQDGHLLVPLTACEPPEGAADSGKGGGKGGGGKGGEKGKSAAKDKGKPAAAEPAAAEEDTRPVDFRWAPIGASLARPWVPPPAAGARRGLGGAHAATAHAARGGHAAAMGAGRAVAVGDEHLLVFGGGDGLEGSIHPLHDYTRAELLPELSGATPAADRPTIALRDLVLSGPVSADSAALVLRARRATDGADDDGSAAAAEGGPELARAALTAAPSAAASAPAAADASGSPIGPQLTCAALGGSLEPGESDASAGVRLELWQGEHLVGSAPLAPLLRGEASGHVRRAGLAAVAGASEGGGARVDGPGYLLNFAFERRHMPPPPPPLVTLSGAPAPTRARAALDEKRAGSGSSADEYVGQFVDGVPHGVGTCSYASGAVYEGQWRRGLRHGEGELRDENGSVYRGGFEGGVCAGQGAWHYADGSVYRGPMVCGLRHGKGVYRSAEGATYDGDWDGGVRCGSGAQRSADGLTMYSGEWLDDARHGKGRLVVRESERTMRQTAFEGEWRHNVRHGYGKLAWPSGDTYEGQWQNDMRNGRGLLRCTSGDQYDGKWVGDVRCGDGTLVANTGERYCGQWRAGERAGFGTCTYTDGTEYKGQWRAGQRHGRGRLVDARSGASYEGQWSMGQRHGAGREADGHGERFEGVFHADARSGHGVLRGADGSWYEGNWARGLCEGEGTFCSADGERYKGQWVGGERSGHGVCEFSDGSVYEGEWSMSMRCGRGELKYSRNQRAATPLSDITGQPGASLPPGSSLPTLDGASPQSSRPRTAPGPTAGRRTIGARGGRRVISRNGRGLQEADEEMVPVYTGDWKDGEQSGLGRFTSSQEAYEGEWHRGVRHGRGVTMLPSGECYVGEWCQGKRQGTGSLANPQ